MVSAVYWRSLGYYTVITVRCIERVIRAINRLLKNIRKTYFSYCTTQIYARFVPTSKQLFPLHCYNTSQQSGKGYPDAFRRNPVSTLQTRRRSTFPTQYFTYFIVTLSTHPQQLLGPLNILKTFRSFRLFARLCIWKNTVGRRIDRPQTANDTYIIILV